MKKEQIFGSILAGSFIAMAAVAYLACSNAVIGSVLFAFGLLTIVNYNFQLFTGVVGYISVQKNGEYLKYSLFSVLVWVLNFVGAIFVGTLISLTRSYDKIRPRLETLMEAKCNDSVPSLIVLGIFCGILMFIAVNTYKRTDAHPVAKVTLLILCVVVFILSGYEHCVANMGYVAMYQAFNMQIVTVMLATSCGNIIGCNLVPLMLRLAGRWTM